jgi:hypothetical protein
MMLILLLFISPAIDAGVLTELHCLAPGFNTSGCIEWFGKAPDIGALEFRPPATPTQLRVVR